MAKKYMVVGGGSGGHTTPLIAVAAALKAAQPDCEVALVGQKNENLTEALESTDITISYAIHAGKFRRYHGESFLSHLFDVKTVLLNIRDVFRVARGTFQAWRIIGSYRPDAIFLKGGFVSVPVGWAARLRSIPYITHDSDAVAGLANKITAKHAVFNTTAMPAHFYPYDEEKVRVVGIPLRQEFVRVGPELKVKYRTELRIPKDGLVVFCIGGGLGAQRLNQAIVQSANDWLTSFPSLHIIHITGKKLFAETEALYAASVSEDDVKQRVRLYDFHSDVHQLSGAADVVITRAGATNLAEFAVQGKACVVVPSPFLTGGQQLHNAKALREVNGAVIVEDADQTGLAQAVHGLLQSPEDRLSYETQIQHLAVDNAAEAIASLLTDIASSENREGGD